jgi:uncharacterized protein involved in exopolysaccharide biosynthesis
MLRDASIDVLDDGQTVEIAYVSPSPRMAMLVTERLASLFINDKLNDRSAILHSAVERSSASPSDAEVQTLERESLKTTYRDLLAKREQVLRSANLERQQIGEQFKILDGARLPEAPISPDRRRLTLLGAVIGFCLGVAMMVGGRERSFRRQKKMLAQL